MTARRSAVAALLATMLQSVGAASLDAAAPDAANGSFVLIRARTVGGASDSISGGIFAATISVAQPDAQPGTASGGSFSATGGVVAPQQPRPDAVFASGFE